MIEIHYEPVSPKQLLLQRLERIAIEFERIAAFLAHR